MKDGVEGGNEGSDECDNEWGRWWWRLNDWFWEAGGFW